MKQINGRAVEVAHLGSGPPAVMIHCMLAAHASLLPLARALPVRATLFDLPGHGRSADWDGKTDYHELATGIAASLCDGPTHLIGHSFGATVALRMAVERPDLVSRLTLIEPVCFAVAKGTTAHSAHIREFRPFIAAMLSGTEAKAAELFNALWGNSAWSSLSERRRAYLVERIHLVVAGSAVIEEDPEGITSPDRLARLNIPVTLIRGAQSRDVIAAVHAALVARIPGATDLIVPEGGHMVPISHPEQVAAIIRATDPGTG